MYILGGVDKLHMGYSEVIVYLQAACDIRCDKMDKTYRYKVSFYDGFVKCTTYSMNKLYTSYHHQSA